MQLAHEAILAHIQGKGMQLYLMYLVILTQESDPAAVPGRCLSIRKGVFITLCTSKSLYAKKSETFTYKLSRKSLITARVII